MISNLQKVMACVCTSAIGLPLGAHALGPREAAARPNVVIIYTDDMGYGDLQSYNPERGRIPTPHMDRLAAEGMRFTDAHASSGVCSPSRYTLLTGRYHWRSTLPSDIVREWAPPIITPGRMTFADLARQDGYTTACIGKWHLGWNWPIEPQERPVFTRVWERDRDQRQEVTDGDREIWRRVFSRAIGGGPTSVGFDYFFGVDIPNWPPYVYIENDRTLGIPTTLLDPEGLRHRMANIQGPALPDWKLEQVLPALGDRAVSFIEDAARATRPFLLYLPLTSPHTPLAVNPEWKGRSGLNDYGDFMMETDAEVGRILAALERAGLANNTLVILTSDNGFAPVAGKNELEAKGHYPSAHWRGQKADAWEGGHRVPFIVRWPGVVAAGSVSDHLVHQADIFATLADILGKQFPDDAGEDSVSLLPILRGDSRPVRQHAVSTGLSGLPALRDGPWKLILGEGSGGYGWKPEHAGSGVQLYNLAEDPAEATDLSLVQPERVSAMKTLFENLLVSGRSTPGATVKNDVDHRWVNGRWVAGESR